MLFPTICKSAFIASLLQFTHIIGPTDERGLLTVEKALDLGLSSGEVEQIRSAAGIVACGFTDDPNGLLVLSATLIEFNFRITTNVHVFKGNLDLTKCRFRIFNEKSWHRLVFSAANLDTIKSYYSISSSSEIIRDKIVVLLASPVERAQPFAVPKENIFGFQKQVFETDTPTTPVFVVSASEDDFENDSFNPFDSLGGGMPIIRKCNVRQWYVEWKFYRSDCDVDHGASGGVNLVRYQGSLWAVAISTKASLSIPNYNPYSPSNSTRSIQLLPRDYE